MTYNKLALFKKKKKKKSAKRKVIFCKPYYKSKKLSFYQNILNIWSTIIWFHYLLFIFFLPYPSWLKKYCSFKTHNFFHHRKHIQIIFIHYQNNSYFPNIYIVIDFVIVKLIFIFFIILIVIFKIITLRYRHLHHFNSYFHHHL